MKPPRSPLKETWSRNSSHRHQRRRAQEHTARGFDPASTHPRRSPGDESPKHTRNRPPLATWQTCAQWPTTSVLTAAMLVYALGAGITAAAGTRLALQLILITVFGLHPLQVPLVTKDRRNCCGSLLPRQNVLALGNLRACCPPW